MTILGPQGAIPTGEKGPVGQQSTHDLYGRRTAQTRKTKDENNMDPDNHDRGTRAVDAVNYVLQAQKEAANAGIRKDKAMNTGKTEDIATLVPNRPDTEVSDELRARMEKALEPVAEIMNEALRHHGLVIGFNGFPFNPLTGKYMAPSGKAIDISRHY